jgi:tripartite-type tricarboxylate transporter receptor subunit TctC
MKKLPRREFLHLAAGAAAVAALPRSAAALDYPTRPVHVVAGYPAGAGPDIIARLISQALSESMGQQFIVDNRPGASSNIGTEIVAHAAPDGYTLLTTVSTNAVNATFYTNLNFDFARDLVPVAGIGRTPFVFAANPGFAPKTIPELIAYAKANPGHVNFATQGVGSGPHVSAELFKMLTGVDLVHVPYKGNYTTDLIGGQIPLAVAPIAQVIEFIRDGRLRGIAVTTATGCAARRGGDRRIRAGLRGGRLVRHHRASGDAHRHRRQARRGDRRRRQRRDVQIPPGGARRRVDADDHGPIQQIRHRRNCQMGQGGEIRVHQGGLKSNARSDHRAIHRR